MLVADPADELVIVGIETFSLLDLQFWRRNFPLAH